MKRQLAAFELLPGPQEAGGGPGGGREGAATGGTYMLRDPATSGGSVRVSAGALEDARRAFGTDEDILLVARRALC